ncbi:hypothetical protein CLSAP_54920 [Clostridium saccharoperbutylacetonicum]|nr:hypothetical protein CLSAP_54920 [Clostridium saccharoperbutylacetonicum]NSB34034.1 hypothetical protein [Clostridium saccharoperbutylacetonicum]
MTSKITLDKKTKKIVLELPKKKRKDQKLIQ